MSFTDYGYSNSLEVIGDSEVILTLENDNVFNNSNSSIHIGQNSELTIQGTGSLRADSSGDSGILNEGTLTINGGRIHASTDNSFADGIENSAGTLIINGGSVTAEADPRGDHGAGIGSRGGGVDGNITISGGIVNATGNEGAGIGGGPNGAGGNITISGGIVNATSESGAGIGGGNGGAGGNITISGGIVNATSESGAGIGGGNGGAVETVTISGGIVNATSTNGCGIGNDALTVDDSNITISGGIVNAISTKNAGMGDSVGSITISGGTVNATSTKDHGIRVCYTGSSGEHGIIAISGGTVNATSTDEAGISSGNDLASGDIIISGGVVTASSDKQKAIGHVVSGSAINTLTIQGTSVSPIYTRTGDTLSAALGSSPKGYTDTQVLNLNTITMPKVFYSSISGACDIANGPVTICNDEENSGKFRLVQSVSGSSITLFDNLSAAQTILIGGNSGASSTNRLTVNASNATSTNALNIILSDLTIDATDGAPINITAGQSVNFVLRGTNRLTTRLIIMLGYRFRQEQI